MCRIPDGWFEETIGDVLALLNQDVSLNMMVFHDDGYYKGGAVGPSNGKYYPVYYISPGGPNRYAVCHMMPTEMGRPQSNTQDLHKSNKLIIQLSGEG